MVVRKTMIDGTYPLYYRYRKHTKTSKGRVYVYHQVQAEFDGQTYKASSSASEVGAKDLLAEKVRVPLRDRVNGAIISARPQTDKFGVLTENAAVSAWAERWCDELDRRAESGEGSRIHAGRSRGIWDTHLRGASVDSEDPRSFGNLIFSEVEPDHVRYAIRTQAQRIHFKRGRDKPSKYSPSQKRQWRAFISGMYSYAQSRGKRVTNPVGRHNSIPGDPKVVRDILTKAEIKKLWDYVQCSPRDMLLVAIGLIFTRPGEAAGLEWSDIGANSFTICRQARAGRREDKDLPDAVVTKRGAVRVTVDRAKTERSTGRVVDYTPLLRQAVRAAKDSGVRMSGPVITDDDGLRVTSGWISAYIPKLVIRAGIRRRNAYILKHTSCSHFLTDGGSLSELEKQSGVAAATLLRYYSHCIPAEAANRMASWDLTRDVA